MANQAEAVDTGSDDLDRRGDMILNGRYKIVGAAPLPAFDTPTARAFRVEDLDNSGVEPVFAPGLFARVNETGLPSRDWEIDVLRELQLAHLMDLIDIGTIDRATETGAPDRAVRAVILDYPLGGRLIAPGSTTAMPLQEVMERVIAPLCTTLETLHESNVFHRAIHPDNLFVGASPDEEVILGECVSCAAGHNLAPAFQPLERASAAPLGCGAGDRAADVFSFGVTIAALLAGKIPGADVDPDVLLHARMERGSLTVLCGFLRFPRHIERLLAGMLADDPADRWTLAQVKDWLDGRHVTVAADRGLDKPVRSFPFVEQKIQNPIAIAEAFNRHWSEAVLEIQSGRLEKWLAADRHRLLATESVISLRENNASGGGKLTNDALVSRVCMALDPQGPIRFKGITVAIDAIGVMLAFAFIEGRQELATSLAAILDHGLPTAWIASVSERCKEMTGESNDFIRLRQYLKNTKLGNGLERCLYDMNPSLGCLCPLIDTTMSGDAAALLTGLNEHCSPSDDEPPWTDRHVGAYLAAHMHPRSDALLASLAMPANAQASETMIGVALVSLAQDRLAVPLLPRLTRAAEPRLSEIIDTYNSETRRKALRAALEPQLNKGDFTALMKLLNDNEQQEQDRYDYYQARDLHRRMDIQITGLNSGQAARRFKAAVLGRKIAAWIAFCGLVAVSFAMLVGLTT